MNAVVERTSGLLLGPATMKGKTVKRIILTLCLLLSDLASAEDRKPLELDVSGELIIDKQGAVLDYKINAPLEPPVKQLVDTAVRKWRFEPVLRGGVPVNAKSLMYLSLTAMPVDAGYQLKVDRVRFGGTRILATHPILPRYPLEAVRARVNAEVIVALRIDGDGKVVDAVAVRSRLLNAKGPEKLQAALRKRFEQASVIATKSWTYQAAEAGDVPETTVLLPVSYCVGEGCQTRTGEWRVADATNPAHPVPWLPADKQQFDTDGLRDGQMIAVDNAIKLQAPVVVVGRQL
ncbi:energy transducer TonB [Lysobacter sp. CFH 32150]|uniref:energy transducer TonB n=1 Tax=Lysobacter sp. CFH 32150 TaxID=2927128 RepID=UPI001FA7B8E8|nr:energy transducer TonB [Lysobacter sp. CFH 32150]MCI4568107.1 energy transducer TonB [Lysobacter sp. CFH 32150]